MHDRDVYFEGTYELPRFMSYWQAAHRQYLEQAAEETGYDVRVESCDTDELGRTGYVKIVTYDERTELTPFWERYYELVAAAESEE